VKRIWFQLQQKATSGWFFVVRLLQRLCAGLPAVPVGLHPAVFHVSARKPRKYIALLRNMPKNMNKSATGFHLEASLNRIREIQGLLQDGSQPFDDSITLFEEATLLIGQCRTYLLEAEVKLQSLSAK